MCVIIALKENEYDAWFSSCTRGEDALTPLKGHYSRTTISNHFSKDRELLNLLPSEPELSFYSLQWETQFEEGTAYLASPDDLENNRGSDRWLRSVDPALFSTYLADSPFTLHMNPQLESEQ